MVDNLAEKVDECPLNSYVNYRLGPQKDCPLYGVAWYLLFSSTYDTLSCGRSCYWSAPSGNMIAKGSQDHQDRVIRPQWDVDSVIQYLAFLEEDNVLSLRTLSQKTALVMSLVEASRTYEL